MSLKKLYKEVFIPLPGDTASEHQDHRISIVADDVSTNWYRAWINEDGDVETGYDCQDSQHVDTLNQVIYCHTCNQEFDAEIISV